MCCIWLLCLALPIFTYALDDEEILDLICYTCAETSSNELCNRFAFDRPCISGSSFCQTVHVIDSNSATTSVIKRCATSSECTRDTVGCFLKDEAGAQTCTACCDENYCNEFAPTNQSTAVFSYTRGSGISLQNPTNAWWLYAELIIFWITRWAINSQCINVEYQ